MESLKGLEVKFLKKGPFILCGGKKSYLNFGHVTLTNAWVA
jgi:hypothetical protein